jgi:hypothetical protein
VRGLRCSELASLPPLPPAPPAPPASIIQHRHPGHFAQHPANAHLRRAVNPAAPGPTAHWRRTWRQCPASPPPQEPGGAKAGASPWAASGRPVGGQWAAPRPRTAVEAQATFCDLKLKRTRWAHYQGRADRELIKTRTDQEFIEDRACRS